MKAISTPHTRRSAHRLPDVERSQERAEERGEGDRQQPDAHRGVQLCTS